MYFNCRTSSTDIFVFPKHKQTKKPKPQKWEQRRKVKHFRFSDSLVKAKNVCVRIVFTRKYEIIDLSGALYGDRKALSL